MLEVVNGDCRQILRGLPNNCIDQIITSPPYWRHRDYPHPDCIGQEKTVSEYVDNLKEVFTECYRVLAPTGLFCHFASKR